MPNPNPKPDDRHRLVNDLDTGPVYRPILLKAALLGGGAGLVLGGLFGFLCARGEISATGFSQFAAAGPGVATFTAAGIGLAVGALIGGLIALTKLKGGHS